MSTKPKVYSGPLTKKEMDEYAKEMDALAKNPPVEQTDEATSENEDPTTPPVPVVNTEEDTYKKRFIDGKKFYDENISKERRRAEQAEQRAKELEEQLKTQPAKKFAEEDAIKKFETDYDVAPVIKQIASDISQDNVKAAVAEIRKELDASEAAKQKLAEDVSRLAKVHPDWSQLENDPIFLSWLDKQSPVIKELADYSKNKMIDGAIAVLDMFKAQVKGSPKPSGQNNKNLSKNVVVNSRAEIPNQQPGLLNINEWEKRYDKAQKSGNRKLTEKLMEEVNTAWAEGRVTQ